MYVLLDVKEYGIDDEPTAGSQKLVKSGGVFDSVITNGPAFDISAHFASGGALATYADLSAALAALNTLGASYKRGGMSIKYVQSSDNMYVRYTYLGTETTGNPNPFINPANWQNETLGTNKVGNLNLTDESDYRTKISEDVILQGTPCIIKINSLVSEYKLSVSVGNENSVSSDVSVGTINSGNIFRFDAPIDFRFIRLRVTSGTFSIDFDLYAVNGLKQYVDEEDESLKNIIRGVIGCSDLQNYGNTISLNNGRISTDGVVSANNTSRYSDPISVGTGDCICVLSTVAISKTYGAVFNVTGEGTQESPYVYSPLLTFNVGWKSYSYIVKTSGKIAISFASNGRYSVNWFKSCETLKAIERDLQSAVDTLNASISSLSDRTTAAEGNITTINGKVGTLQDFSGKFNSESSPNLYNWLDSDNKSGKILGSDGSLSSDSDYWTTGFIAVNSAQCKSIVIKTSKASHVAVLYDESKNVLKYLDTSASIKQIDISDVDGVSVKYIRISIQKGSLAYSQRNRLVIIYANREDVGLTYNAFDGRVIKDAQYFTLNDIISNASNKETCAFTSTFSFLLYKGNCGNKNIIITSNCKYENNVDDAVPTIEFTYRLGNYNQLAYSSPAYTIGGKDDYEVKEWRIPPFLKWCVLSVRVVIPENVTLYIEKLENKFSDNISRIVSGYRLNGHLEYSNYNTKKGMLDIARLGFPTCVCIPKRTSDGVWVCFHDDSNIGASLVDENHEPLTGAEYSASISDITFQRLQQLSWKKNVFGEYRKVPTMEEYLLVCSKTGMSPMFSVHPILSVAEMGELKQLLIKYGLLKKLNFKYGYTPNASGNTILTNAYSVFGDIDSYQLDISNSSYSGSDIVQALQSIEIDTRIVIEFYSSVIALQNVQDVLTAGYQVGCALVNASPMTGEERTYWMSKGVTEWTESNNCSFGLNW